MAIKNLNIQHNFFHKLQKIVVVQCTSQWKLQLCDILIMSQQREWPSKSWQWCKAISWRWINEAKKEH
jgi:hypothetical protein